MKRSFAVVFIASAMATTLLLTGCVVNVRLEADVIVPDKIRATTEVSIGGATVVELEMIGIGETVYVMNPMTDEWEVSDDDPGATTMPTLEVVPQIVQTLTELTILDDEEVDGVLCFHVRGSVDSSILSDLGLEDLSMEDQGFEDPGIDVDALETETELWIGKEDFLVRRVAVEGREPGDASESGTSATVTMEFSRFDEPMVIEEPDMVR
jgi:hypothetical protein